MGSSGPRTVNGRHHQTMNRPRRSPHDVTIGPVRPPRPQFLLVPTKDRRPAGACLTFRPEGAAVRHTALDLRGGR